MPEGIDQKDPYSGGHLCMGCELRMPNVCCWVVESVGRGTDRFLCHSGSVSNLLGDLGQVASTILASESHGSLGYYYSSTSHWVSLVSQLVNNLTAMQETWARSPGEGNGYPLQYFCLENFMDRGAWWAIVHRVTKSQTRLSD